MPKHSVKDEHMAAAGLSDEEMAALEDDTEEGEEESDTKATETDGDGAVADSDTEVLPQAADDEKAGAVADHKEVDAASDDTGDKDDGEAAAADASASTDDAAAAAKPSEDDEDESTAPPPVGVDAFRAQLAARGIPEDYEDQLKAANDAVEALDARLAEGEIDYAAHAKENRELTTTLAELAAQKREAEFVAGNNEVMADQHWNWEVDRFTEENEEFKNPVVYGALRGALEELYADEENGGKSYRWFLRTAATSVRDAFNMDKPAIPADEGDKDDEVKRTEQIQDEQKSKPQEPPPKTLGAIPVAGETEESTDEFAQIDKLEGMDLEAALAKMPKAKVEKYLDSRSY
jgi:hypothetical protein